MNLCKEYLMWRHSKYRFYCR